VTVCDINRHTYMRAAIASLLIAVSASAADLPRYWSVHIDTPSDQATYEKLDTAYYSAIRNYYAALGLTPAPVVPFQTGDGVHYGLRPRGSLADFEKPSVLSDEQRKELNAITAPISADTHKTLRTHHNEIWELDRDLSNVTNTRAPKYMVLRTDYVHPPQLEKYEAAMKALIEGLAEKEIRVLAFLSVYGDGGYRYLFMSGHPFKVPKRGEAWATRDIDATPRADLSGDTDRWLQY